MTPPPTGSSSEHPLLLYAFGLLTGLASVAIIVGLFTYSLTEVLGSSSSPSTNERAVSARAAPQRIATLPPGSAVWSTAWPVSELMIFILCQEETVASAIYDGPIYNMYITLRPATDREAIRDVLAGTDSLFPPDARIFQSTCVKAGVERGDYP